MAFTTIPTRQSATAAAEHALREAILSGELAPGEKLPPERELSVKLGISRLTLRAALATLSAAGLVSVRHGSGYRVRDMRETGGADLLPGLLDQARASKGTTHAIADLMRLRRHLAGAVLDALVERPPSKTARRGYEKAVDRFAAAAATGSVDAIADADLGVVHALLDATDSMVLRVCLNPIARVVQGDPELRAAIYAEPAGNLAGWRALESWLVQPVASVIPMLIGVLAERDRSTVKRLAKARLRRRR